MNVHRRTFLMSSTGAALMAQGGAPVATAVIGTGNRGAYLLSGVIEQPNAKVAAVCDIKPDRLDKAATAAAKHNPQTYTDWRQIIDRKDIDAVFVATPPHLHSEMAMAALQSGKHVYCEKPIGVTAAQVRDLLKVAKATKKVFTAGQQMRSYVHLQEAMAKIRGGAIGDVLWMKAQRHGTADLDHEGPSKDWYFDVTKSGGYLIEMSVHNLDLCNWAIGAHPVKASGFGGIQMYKNDPAGRTIFDCGIISYDYTNGVKMSFTQNVFHPRTLPGGGQYAYVYGSKGAVDLIGNPTLHTLGRDGKSSPFVEKREEGRHAHITGFYDAVTKGAASPADITVGATAALTAILGHEAMTRQAVVSWKDLGVDVG